MTNQIVSIASIAGSALIIASPTTQAIAQTSTQMGAAHSIVPNMRAPEPADPASPRGPIIASLTYDGTSTWGFAGQDFESVFDLYDTFCCEIFSISADANVTEFRITGFGNGNPFGMTDMLAQIYRLEDLADLCDDNNLPEPVMISTPGVGFYDGVDGVTNFDGQCLRAGEYIIRSGSELEFGINGHTFWFGQAGPHDNGGGAADDAFQNNPGNAFGMGECFDVVDGGTGLRTGINFILAGETGSCGPDCPDPTACGDWTGDGTSDADDFFAYLDSFSSGDSCADIDADGDLDSFDFFLFLDAFIQPC